MKIEIKNRYNNSILFSYECEENTILVTLLEGIEKGANLHGANLHGADLEGADLLFANLHRANLEGANLHGANLEDADLEGANLHLANLEGANLHRTNLHLANLHGANLHRANLEGANLRGVSLHGANLHGANLHRANLEGANLKDAIIPIYCKWHVSIINQEFIKIGCKEKTIKEWVEWFENSNEVFQTNRDTDDFKRIRAMFYAHKTYIENL